MKFNQNIQSYINGDLFSSGKDILFNDKYLSQSRIDCILALVTNKKIVHFGFADHPPLIDEKIQQGKWLHQMLIEKTSHCAGIDNNVEAVNLIKKRYKIENIYHLDIIKNTEIPTEISQKTWDFLILGELIEHVDNPVLFLSELRKKFGSNTKKIIITAPNVFNTNTIIDIRKNQENINTDHRYWFSPYTLNKVAHNSGLKNIEFTFAEQIKLSYWLKIKKLCYKILQKPLFLPAKCFNSIVLIADIQ